MSPTMSGCSLHQLFILWNTPQPFNSSNTEHCTYCDGFTLSEAVTCTPTTNDYLQLTFPKFRTLEKFTYRNVSLLTLTYLRRCQVVLLYQLFILWKTPQPLNSLSTEHCTHSDGFTLSEAVTGNTYLLTITVVVRLLAK